MVTVVDSKEKPLPAPTVVLTYMSEADLPPDIDLKTALAMWVKEMTLPDVEICLLYTSPSPRDRTRSRMPSSA